MTQTWDRDPRLSASAETKRYMEQSLKEGFPVTEYKVGYFIGSLARGSINRRLANPLVRLAPGDLDMAEVSFSDLPLSRHPARDIGDRVGTMATT